MIRTITVDDLRRDLTAAEIRAEAAFMRRRVHALEKAERAMRKAAADLRANGDRDISDLLFQSWGEGDRELDEAREYLLKINRAAHRRLYGAEPALPVMRAAAA